MRKIAKKVLSTVLVLSLLASVYAVASFAAERVSLKDLLSVRDCENGDTWNPDLTFNVEVKRGFDSSSDMLENCNECYINDNYVGNDKYLNRKWVQVGGMLYLISVLGDSCMIWDMRPFSVDAMKAKVIKIPDFIDNMKVRNVQFFNSDERSKVCLDEKFPSLEFIVFSKNLNNYLIDDLCFSVSKALKEHSLNLIFITEKNVIQKDVFPYN